ncbi:hypothetical protein [Bordetella genomosp. 6]|uniref:hypothetical protein n=1 Tax=Bordetella genomosp. 6 TaxID=463024 RepID=UPI000A291D7A|nr:hypothetical protein [Bordetella genomosp. 6]ARP79135.1 hypothetical protein CAL11_07715 [Bordetella genomosp. 6]
MALVLARFGFGFCMLLAALVLLVAATLLATRLVGWAVRAFALERSQALASGVAIFVLVALALWGCHAVGEALYGAIGATALVGGAPHWLAGNSHLSAAALMGATTAAAMLAGGPAFWRWLRARRAAAAEQPAARKAAPPKGAKPAARAAKAAARTQLAPRGQRIPWLGWTAFFLLFIGAAVLAFAYIVAPIEAGASGLRLEHATRARPVYLAGLTLLGGGAFFLLAWLSRRRTPRD